MGICRNTAPTGFQVQSMETNIESINQGISWKTGIDSACPLPGSCSSDILPNLNGQFGTTAPIA